jgi:hypothetical protein
LVTGPETKNEWAGDDLHLITGLDWTG